MSYKLNSVTIRTNNTSDGINKINELFTDIISGKLPILFNSDHVFVQGISPVSMYSNYATDESGDYDLSIMGVTSEFFKNLEIDVCKGKYKKYDVSGDSKDIMICTQQAWKQVWEEQHNGIIKRAFTKDYESTVPGTYTKDGKAHCYLYIAV